MKPNLLLCFALVLSGSWTGCSTTARTADVSAAKAMPRESPIALSVAIPAHNHERRVEYNDRNTHFHVIVSNTSDTPRRIWQEWCSWGYFGLTFEFSDENGRKWVAGKKERVWTLNSPDWWTLDPHESFVIDVYFPDSEIWLGFPLPGNGSQTVTMRAVLEFKPDDEARQHDVWTGRVASKAQKFTFYHWKSDAK